MRNERIALDSFVAALHGSSRQWPAARHGGGLQGDCTAAAAAYPLTAAAAGSPEAYAWVGELGL